MPIMGGAPSPAVTPPPGGAAGGPPAGAQTAAPKTPPFGSTPAVTPNANQGLQVAGMMKVGVSLKFLTEALNAFGPSSDEGQALLKAITALSKIARPGSVSPAGEANQLQKAQMQNTQNSALMQATKQGMDQGGQPGQPPAPPTPPQGAM